MQCNLTILQLLNFPKKKNVHNAPNLVLEMESPIFLCPRFEPTPSHSQTYVLLIRTSNTIKRLSVIALTWVHN
jgi:hypothetical protein